MSTQTNSEHDTSTTSGALLAFARALRRSFLLSLGTVGVLLVLVGVALELFTSGRSEHIMAGMFGIWGASAAGFAALAYGLLWLNRKYEDHTRFTVGDDATEE